MYTNPTNYRATGSVNIIGKYFHTIITLHYPDGKTKQISKTTKLAAYNAKGDISAANRKQALDLLAIRKTDEIAKAVQKAKEAVQNMDIPNRNNHDILFVDACEAWVARYKKSDTTKEAYALTCRAHLRPYFEPLGLHLSEVSEDILQGYIDSKTSDTAPRKLAGKTVKKHMAVITGTLKAAKKKGVIQSVFWDSLEYPEDEKFEATVYSQQELQTLLNASVNTPIHDVVVLISMLALRRSEVLGLQWSLIDLDKGTARIRDTVVYVTSTIHKQKAKNAKSDRVLPLSQNTVTYLRKLKAKQEQDKKDFGNSYYDSDFVCRHEDGTPIKIRYFNNHFNKLLAKKNLRVLRPHDLRHTAASLLIDAGENIKVVQDYLGHSSPSTTLGIYAHAFEAREKAAAEKLGNAFTF